MTVFGEHLSVSLILCLSVCFSLSLYIYIYICVCVSVCVCVCVCVYMYKLSSLDRLFRCITTLQCYAISQNYLAIHTCFLFLILL